MKLDAVKRKLSVVVLLLPLILTIQGCSYVQNRWSDVGDVIDVGFTFSKKPQFALFYDFIPVVPIGFGWVDGYFTGLGGGKVRDFSPHWERSFGLVLWGQEDLSFEYSLEELQEMPQEEREDVMNFQRTGLFGMVQGPFPDQDYLISCPHYIHIGWIGVVASPRYLQMLDLVVGFTTIDIGADDPK